MKSKDKLIAALADVNDFGIYIDAAARKAGLSVTTVKKILGDDDGSAFKITRGYCAGRARTFAFTAMDRISLKK